MKADVELGRHSLALERSLVALGIASLPLGLAGIILWLLAPRLVGPEGWRSLAVAALAAQAFLAGASALVLFLVRRRHPDLQKKLKILDLLQALHRAEDVDRNALVVAMAALSEVAESHALGLWARTHPGSELRLRLGTGSLAGREGLTVQLEAQGDERESARLAIAKLDLSQLATSPEGESVPAGLALFAHGVGTGGESWLAVSFHPRATRPSAISDEVLQASQVIIRLLFRMDQHHVDRMLHEATALLASSVVAPRPYEEVLALLASLLGSSVAELWMRDWHGPGYIRAAYWHEGDETAPFVNSIGEDAPYDGPSDPHLAKPDWHSTLMETSSFHRATRAQEAGLHSAVSLPLTDETQDLGVVVLYGQAGALGWGSSLWGLEHAAQALSESLRAYLQVQRTNRKLGEASQVLDDSPVGIARWDKSGIIRWANPAQLHLLGYSPSEYIGHHFSEFHADPQSRIALQEGLAMGKPLLGLPGGLIHKDGKSSTVVIDALPSTSDEHGAEWVVFVRDISELKQREQALRQSHGVLEQRLANQTQELLRLHKEHLGDISLRLEAERAALQSQTRFRSLIRYLIDIVAVLDSQGKITFISPSVERWLGHSPEMLVGRSFHDLVHPDDLTDTMKSLTAMVTDPDQPGRFEFRGARADGSWASMEAVGRSHLDDEAIAGIVINLRDVSDRLRQEQELRQSEESFSLLVRSVKNYAIILLDKDGRVASWNDGAVRITGYPAEEIIGQSLAKFYTVEDLKAGMPQRHLELALADRHLMYTGRHVRKDGTTFWVEVALTPLFDDQGSLSGYAKVTRDITERREVEENLRHSRSLLAEAQHIAETGDWEWDIANDRSSWSAEFSRILGIEAEAQAGGPNFLLDRVHPDDRERVAGVLSRALQDRRPFDVEHRVLRADGELRVLRTRGHVEPMAPDPAVRMVGIGQDITDRKRIEEALLLQTELHLSLLEAQSELGEGVLLSEGDVVVYANRAVASLSGLEGPTASSLTSFLDSVDPGRITPLRADMEARLDRPLPPARGESTLARPDGSRLHIAYTVSAVAGHEHTRTILLMRDETVRRQAVEVLQQSRERLRQFSTELQRVREEESSRISREIHDELGQQLTGLKLDLAWLAGRLQTTDMPNLSLLLEKTRGMSQLVDLTVEQVRRIASELRPGVLDDLGLSAALEWQAGEFEARTGISCTLQADADTASVPQEHATAMFRIFQEALTNVARHAQAKKVRVRLAIRDHVLHMTVEDDGRGISEEELQSAKSLGLLGMRERARLLGGEATIARGNPRGTIIQISLPLPEAPPGRDTP